MNILGLMSGSSLDGLDMALCQFRDIEDGTFEYALIASDEIPLPSDLLADLTEATQLSGYELCLLEAKFSRFLGQCCLDFSSNHSVKIDLIASHGHTIFHSPHEGFTTQIGNGGTISQLTKCDVVTDFRSSDVAAGGQGAPFAPIADHLLFSEIDIMLNLGGIANISFKQDGAIKALDISPANQLLNFLAAKVGQPYDEGGNFARKGKVDQDLLTALLNINSFNDLNPRGMDNSWVTENFLPLISNVDPYDGLRTGNEFINLEIVKAVKLAYNTNEMKTMMITGGGAFNTFLMEDLSLKLHARNVIVKKVSEELIKFKEAIMIALMGYLRMHKKHNVLSSYTGASRHTIGGAIYAY